MLSKLGRIPNVSLLWKPIRLSIRTRFVVPNQWFGDIPFRNTRFRWIDERSVLLVGGLTLGSTKRTVRTVVWSWLVRSRSGGGLGGGGIGRGRFGRLVPFGGGWCCWPTRVCNLCIATTPATPPHHSHHQCTSLIIQWHTTASVVRCGGGGGA